MSGMQAPAPPGLPPALVLLHEACLLALHLRATARWRARPQDTTLGGAVTALRMGGSKSKRKRKSKK